ncbi:MAG: major facilitator superfamily 1 [Frankiales bacterium]|nr:major facilitator superfamily 1 [Frankiales bacterium]
MSLPTSLRQLPREVWVLASVAFAVAVGFGIVAPAIPLFAKTFGVDNTAAASVVSAFAFMRLLTAPIGGRVVDRFGERVVMATGVGIVAVSSALAGMAQTYPQLLVLRGVGGFGSALFTVSAATLLLRSVPGELRGRASGMFSGGFLLGGISGPALGGFVTGIDIRLPFFLYAGTLAVAVTIALVALRHSAVVNTDQAARRQIERTAVFPLFRNASYRAALATNFADAWAMLGVRSALLPIFVSDVLHKPPSWTGAGFVVVAVVNAAVLLPAGRFSDTVGRRPVLVTGCTIGAAALVVLALVPNVGGYLVAMALLGLGSGLLDVAPAAMAGDVAGRRGGGVIAAYQMSGDLGMIVGPLMVGYLADHASFSTGFLVTAGAFGVAAVLGVIAPETHHRPLASPQPEAEADKYSA